MDDDLADNDERAIELSSIAAIYPEIVIDPSSPFKATLDITVTPSTALKVVFQTEPDRQPAAALLTPPTSLETDDAGFPGRGDPRHRPIADDDAPDIHFLSHLPPLSLYIELPEGYPSEAPPGFTISTTPKWLDDSQVSELIQQGRTLWEECGRDMTVYAYIDHLQTRAEEAFGMADNVDGECKLSRDWKIALLDFDIKAKRQKFEQETFRCSVCLEPKKGANCHRLLLCSHVFCVPCLQDFYNSCIAEGDVDNVKCLDPDCGKDSTPAPMQATQALKRRKKPDRTLNPSELLQIPLEPDVVQRYVQLKRKKKLESDKTTIYCPRKWCQGAARSKKHPKPIDPLNADGDVSSDDDDEPMPFDPQGEEAQLPPMSERLSVCEDCGYAFCSVCKKGWHGELERCFPRRAAELSAEEKATEDYFKLYTTPCPTCMAPCQKSMGCNHMICFKCRTHFCYLCSSWLDESNPYKHFNDVISQCYMRLWDLEGGDGQHDENEEEEQPPFRFYGDEDDDEGPEWEFADDSDDNDDLAVRRQHPPPPAPVPPVDRAHHNQDQNANGLDAAGMAAARERQAQERAIHQARDRARAREGAPRLPQRAIVNNRPLQMVGLQRFLHLVQNDQEDEWDSDELDDL